MSKETSEPLRRGRPRGFDADAALERALAVFWAKGYEGASLSDLTTAMGIAKPSLYAAFGDKEELFRRALARYIDGPGAAPMRALLAAPTARAGIAAMLETAARSLAPASGPKGCLAVHGALACSGDAARIADELAACRARTRAAIQARLEAAAAAGERLPAPPAVLARFVTTTFEGMAVEARTGAGVDDLMQTAAFAMAVWPAEPAR